MRSFVICTAAVLGIAFVGSTQVEAGNRHGRHRNYGNRSGHGFNRGSGSHRNYNRYSWGSTYNNGHYGGGNVSHRNSIYRNASHLDYHAPSLQRHSYHLDYTPVHYDAHRSGHHDF